MSIFKVKEFVIKPYECNGEGIYSSLAEAQKAILKRVAEDYTKEEMKKFKFTFKGCDEYRTSGNDWTEPCIYYIEEIELNAPIV